jgi:hypothetical protein
MGKISDAMQKVPKALKALQKVSEDLGRTAVRAEMALARTQGGVKGSAKRAASIGAGSNAPRVGKVDPDLVRRTGQRAQQLQDTLGEKSRGRVTMGVGTGRDKSGKMRTVVGSSEPGGYLRPEIKKALKPNEEVAVVPGKGHAEPRIIDYMNKEDIEPIAIGAGRPICSNCEPVVLESGATPASPLKGAPPRGGPH